MLRMYQETISTCRFSQRVALVKNEASINEELDPKLVMVPTYVCCDVFIITVCVHVFVCLCMCTYIHNYVDGGAFEAASAGVEG